MSEFLDKQGRFRCISCGACCAFIKPLADSGQLPKSWVRVDGACKNLSADKLCLIYNARPNICRVNKTLKPNYSDAQIAQMCKVMKDYQEERTA